MEPGYPTMRGEFTPLRSVLAVPLDGPESTVGVLSLYHADKDAFTSDHLRILLAISSRIALAIENALRFQQAESSATTDYLTGLPNARSLFLQLDRELARCKRSHTTLTVMVSDMDGFKQVNDRFGHLEGNRVLVSFAQALKESCREYDYVARMGGDEFVLVAPGLTPQAAKSKAEHLRRIAKQAGIEVCGEDMLSLSIGQAVYPDAGLDAEDLLAEADRRMYLEKRKRPQQRNRRLHPRLRCHLAVELHPEGRVAPVLARLSNISMGGCYVETDAPFNRGSNLELSIRSEQTSLKIAGRIVWVDTGYGFAMQFNSGESEQQLFRIMELVENQMAQMEKSYLSKFGQ